MSGEKKSTSLPRRHFLGIAWGGSLAFLFAQVGVAFLRFIQPVSTGGFGGTVYAGKVEEFAIDSINRIVAGRFYIFRTENGLLALWQKCPHLGCAIPWDEEKGQFHCPCHGSHFNKVGEVLGGPAPRPMDIFPITIENDEVWVDTSKPAERNEFDPSQLAGD